MKDATATVGASLEVLAPYLPYGIKVEYPLVGNPYGETMRRTLVGLDGEMGLATLSNSTTIWAPHCIPVLRPFAQLVEPLLGSTIPAAIDFVRSFLADQYNMDWSGAHIEKVYEGGNIMVSIPDRHPQRYDHSYILHSDWSCLPLEAYAWLVKNHFAVGLKAHQYIEKSGGSPTIKEGGSQS